MKKFIHWIYGNNLFIKDGIMCDTVYWFIKQYICANEMWILSIFAFTHVVIIDRCITYPGLGRSKIDDIKGSDKTYL